MSAILRNHLSERSAQRAARAHLAALAIALPAVLSGSRSLARAEQPASPAATDMELAPIEILSPLDASVLSALDKPLSLELSEEPLLEVVRDLQDKLKVTVWLDDKNLEDAGMACDRLISLTLLKEVPARLVLAQLRRKYGLHYLIQDGMLIFTTMDIAESGTNLVRKAYPVGDLVGDAKYECLLDAIRATEPNSWNANGGNASAIAVDSSKCLVISQTRETHDKVWQLLRSLRAAAKLRPVAPARS